MKDDGVSPLSTGLLLPDAVKHVCDEGQGLRWDVDASCYEVVDGALFEKRFDELRRKRDRDDGTSGRPFSRMHKYYKLEAGERWAKTGARFSPKSPLLLRNLQAAHAPIRPEGYDIHAPIFEESKHSGSYADYEHDPNNLMSVPAQEVGTKRQRLPDLKGETNNYTASFPTGTDMSIGYDNGIDETKNIIDAENIKVRLRTRSQLPYVSDTMEISLQQFLDTVDASGQYFEAVNGRSLQSPDFSTEASSPQVDTPDGLEYPFGLQEGGSKGLPQHGAPRAVKTMEDDAPPPMDRMESSDLFGEIMGPRDTRESLGEMGAWGMWNEASKGDQAYFFPRKAQIEPFFNGSIVALRDGVLVPADSLQSADIFLVVSDKNAKWKGEPHPPKDQEHLGHWCAYLGQVPLQVVGPVKAGSYLGPVGDGSGLARVVRPGEGPVVGIALAAKDGGEAGVVKAMVSVGLNALSVPMETQRDQREEVLRRVDGVGAVAEQARSAKEQAARAVAVAEKTEGKVNGLQHKVDGIEEEVQKVRLQQKQMELQQEYVEPVLSRRQYLWSCFCGLFSITVTEHTGVPAPKERAEPAKPVSLARTVGSTCLKWFDHVVTDTIVNLAMTCILLNLAHLFGVGDVFNGYVHECLEAVFHCAFLLWFLKPLKMVGYSIHFGIKSFLKERAEAVGPSKPPLSQAAACPMKMVYSVKNKMALLLFWYAVAAHIVWHSIHEYKTIAPFGYAYLMVLTLKTVVQVAVRSVLPVHVEGSEVEA
eukprot:CAMPEP_0181339324 /NCGR_PEP_ID=MMETSP1101-20121128/29187_1 /TAXON_ID=46948 /ORGANISM="Rhodomonas abbreviata, Strain Caron Lab Isolate" /LENGTH=758 /DNA_ID=CAMNT_0023450269 /DNA_START=69 /DNA_END=2346 /DNA_ORIENTATION=-